MNIAWDAFLTVFLTSVVGSAVIVAFFSLGVRFVTNADHFAEEAAKGDAKAIRKESVYRSVSYIFFTLCALAALYEVYLIIPAFHK